MIRNYLLIATRNLKSNPFYSLINIIGLSIGIASCLVLVLFLKDQYSYDKFHKNVDHIYRIVNKQIEGERVNYVSITQGALAPELPGSFSEVKAATRVGFLHKSVVVDNKELSFEEKIMAVDSSFFSIFTIPIKSNINPGKAITQNGILISQSEAIQLFGKSDPIGKTVSLRDFGDFRVAGVYEDFPYQSHLQSDYIISFSWIESTEPQALSWSSNSYFSYVLMKPTSDIQDFNKKLDSFVHRFTPQAWQQYQYYLQPITQIHLANAYKPIVSGSIGKILLVAFSMVAIIILLLACFNYMNMATARSARRAMEVGVRKVVGAHRSQLIGQFLMESMILCTLSFILAILWADIGIPIFNAFTGWRLDISTIFKDGEFFSLIMGGNILLALLAGSYPAFFLSKFRPAVVIKGKQIQTSSSWLRKGLVVLQFTLTSMLIILITVVFRQVDYMKSQDLGFNQEQLMFFATNRSNNMTLASFKAELQKIPGVKLISSAQDFPNNNAATINVWPVNSQQKENVKADWLAVDHDYIPVLELKVIAGRNFLAGDTIGSKVMIINEKAALSFGWTIEETVGKKLAGFIFNDSLPCEVVGVIKDFHASSLRREINPLVLYPGAENDDNYIVRLEGNDRLRTSEQIEVTVKQLFPDAPYDFLFFDDYIVNLYATERRTGEVFTFFTILAIVIGCMGLYALSAYEGERRIKELGIRKIMGATSFELIALLSMSFMKLVVLSLVIAAPIGYFLGNIWLNTYAYRIAWSPGLFLQSSIWIMMLAWLTIVYQALKAANLNPVESLRYE